MLTLSKQQIESFQQEILSWYAEHKRDLPWRHTRDPYKILVSEVMSQQTQVSRVIPKYEAWIQRFPTIYALAKASTTDVLRYWSGLGYNRRALYLQKIAQELVRNYSLKTQNTQPSRVSDDQMLRKSDFSDSLSYPSVPDIVWPQTEKELMKLPGIGKYTARALLCFAFDQQIAMVDTNVKRVILTQFQMSNVKYQISNKELQNIADQLLPQGHAYEWNQALMDYAARELKKDPSTSLRIKKQAPFKDSDRYYRGQIIKYLLQKRHITKEKLITYFSQQGNPITNERLMSIINGLMKDSLIRKTQNTLQLT